MVVQLFDFVKAGGFELEADLAKAQFFRQSGQQDPVLIYKILAAVFCVSVIRSRLQVERSLLLPVHQ